MATGGGNSSCRTANSSYGSSTETEIVAQLTLSVLTEPEAVALEGEAKRKYFEHAGALLTADGTDDDKIKLEGTPPGYKLVL